MLAVGTEAPDFTVQDQEGQDFTLSSRRGRWVLLWWYPKAATPGWTLQGQSLRDQAQQFADANCDVVGISFDSPTENKGFKDENNFPFPLLSDPDKTVGTQYQILREADDPFADYPMRVAYLIDPDGAIAAVDEVSDPGGYGPTALATLAAAQR